MNSRPEKLLYFACIAAIVSGIPARASDRAPENMALPPPPIMAPQQVAPVERLSPGMYRLGEIVIDKKERAITFPATVNMERGLLEYLLVRTGGKTHESLLKTSVEPYALQIASLLLGLEGTERPLPFQGAPETPGGDAVSITISYQTDDGATRTIGPEAWLSKRVNGTQQTMGPIIWVYTGSVVIGGRFLAQSEGSIIALYHDPVTLIDNASPDGGSDEVWFAREGAVPAAGTPVVVTVKSGR